MKKTRLVALGLGALSIAGLVGAGVGLSANNNVRADEAKAETNLKGATIYLNSSYWQQGNERFAIYAFGDGVAEKWFDMNLVTSIDASYQTYTVTLDNLDYDTLVFCRMNGGTSANNWDNRWNQTVDIKDFDGTNNLFVINGTSDGKYTGSWKSYVGTTKDVYVLDLYGNSLNVNHYVHAFKKADEKTYGTNWPGISMEKVAGTSNIYKASILSNADTIVFHKNEAGYQTNDISYATGCFILTAFDQNPVAYNYKVAEFIDAYMKFDFKDGVPVDDDTKGTSCKENWVDLYTAYTTTYASYQSDIIATEVVKNRLSEWAEANGSSLNLTTGALSAFKYSVASLSEDKTSLPVLVTIVASAIAVASSAGCFFIRKRKMR